MGVDWTAIFEAIGKTHIVSALLPMAFGTALSQLHLWLVSEDAFRGRVTLVKETLIERQAASLASILTQTQAMQPIAEIRSADDDQIAGYVKSTLATLHTHRTLEGLRKRVRFAHTSLMWTIIAAVIGLLVSTPVEAARPVIAICCYALVISQIVIVVWVRTLTKRLEEHEDAI